jgi:hypothetical protein
MTNAKHVGFALSLALTACDARRDDRTSANDQIGRPLRFAHGMKTGDLIAPQTLPCSDGAARALGAPQRVQLVTFSTASDCTECDRHLNGLEELYRQKALPGDAIIVTYAPPARQTEVLAAYLARTARPVCFDERGALWTAHDISHTPVTALIRNGEVVYLDDAPLETPHDLARFRDEIRTAEQSPQ